MTGSGLLAAALRGALYAPKAPSPFALPAREWTLINQRVYFVNNVNRGGPYSPFRELGSFGALFTATNAWRASTFPRVVALSSQVVAYARDTVPVLYGELAAACARSDAGEITRVVAQLKQHADGIAAEANAVAALVKTFAEANAGFDREVERSSTSRWISLLVRPAELEQAVGKLRGVWSAIADDLQHVHEAILHNADALMDLDIDVAADSWIAYGDETSQFTAGAAEQQRVIDGKFVTPIISIRQIYQPTPGVAPHLQLELQSAGPVPVAAGDRLIVFGVVPLDGRVTVARVNAPGDPTNPRYNLLTMRWGCVIDTTETPRGGWGQLYDRWMPVPSVLNFGGFVFDCAGIHGSRRGDDGRLIVRTGDEAEFPVGERVAILSYGGSTYVRDRQRVTNSAGDVFWEYTLEKTYEGPLPDCVWAGMYRDDS